MKISEKKKQKLLDLYNQYMQEICDIKDIKRWAARKTYSEKIETSERTNETKVLGALEGSDYVEGDRMWMFYLPDDSLCLAENFKGEYNKTRLLKNLFNTIEIFDTVVPMDCFPNYSLKKNACLLPGYVAPPAKEKKVRAKAHKKKVYNKMDQWDQMAVDNGTIVIEEK